MQSGALATVQQKELSAMISDRLEDVQQCLTVGHCYASLTVIRCEHREAVTLRGTVWRDYADGTTDWLLWRDAAFGPFDTAEEIRTAALAVTEEIVKLLQDLPASL